MTDVISFPMRLDESGGIAKRLMNSDEQLGEELAVLIATRLGERLMVPAYGVTDFVYTTINTAELDLKVQVFGPPVNVLNVETTYPTPGTQAVSVYFEPRGRKSAKPDRNSGSQIAEQRSRQRVTSGE